ncbi:HpcH/HpaI aldolase/citrate lyase family protein [Achromobacter sp. NPDC058515]|uniref:HpcH/HpaI aldolase/citrate lyase family protein n=1 Tax=Achromobacter sp. NPDC058515 TaxID=3346533 RepID=UPI0036637AFD
MTDRSYLFVPGDRPERFDKALASGAHAVILDLEDAVLPERKPQAREAVRQWMAATGKRVFVRINPASTPWFADDCALLGCGALSGVMLPKAERVEELEALRAGLSGDQQVIPLIETVAGVFQMPALARVPRVARLAFGSFDFMSDSGIQGDGAELDAVRTQFVLHSRHAGLLPPIDGVSLAIGDAAQLELDARRSRRWGFGAKLCIHPSQVPAVHAAFAPTSAEIDWARRVVNALASKPLGAIAVDGKLVDKPVAMLARSILDEAGLS